MLSTLLLGAAGDSTPEAEERRLLTGTKQELARKIEALRREQDFLLFQKTMYASDSKYLILDFGADKGILKYRNRILKTFVFSGLNRSRTLVHGEYVLTAKNDGAPVKRSLVFGNDIVIQTKKYRGTPVKAKGTGSGTRLAVSTREMAALFFAVEPGSRLYVVR